jgi:hemoglobin
MHAVRCWPTVLAAAVMLLIPSNSRAQDRLKTGGMQGDSKEVDAVLYRGLKGAINEGVVLYNAGDHYGCYRLYQGIVLGVKPLVADRPELERTLDAGLAEAEKQQMSWQRAWVLRKALDEVRGKLVPPSAPAPMPASAAPAEKQPKESKPPVKAAPAVAPPDSKKPAAAKAKSTLWDRLGDVNKIIDDFTTLAAADPKVDFKRGGQFKLSATDITHFKQEMVDYVSSVTGGTLPYTPKKTMKEIHQGMKITDAQFNAAKADLRKALQDNRVDKADADALLDIIEKTRKDIVEVPAGAPSPAGKTEAKKGPTKDEPPSDEPNGPRDQSTSLQAEPRSAPRARPAGLRDP